jgi:hypothetical protein
VYRERGRETNKKLLKFLLKYKFASRGNGKKLKKGKRERAKHPMI